jgi:hypothetical protein
MSKFKTPREKKLASLALDARNVYGENDKASRKGIPRSKQLSHKAQRRAAKEPLQAIHLPTEEDDLVALESGVRSREMLAKKNAFRKKPDASIASILEYKRTGDWQLLTRKRS